MKPGRAAAKYNVYLVVERNFPSTNNDGQQVANWQRQFLTWAEITPHGGIEKKVFEQLRAQVTHLIRVRYDERTSLMQAIDWRFNLGNGRQIFNVESAVNKDMRNVEMEFGCTEVQHV